MPLDLSAGRIEEIIVTDKGEDFTYYCTRPDTSMYVAYQSAQVARKGNKVKIQTAEARQRFGLGCLIGFKKGQFLFEGKEISSDKDDPGYVPNWKQLIANMVPNHIDAIAAKLFERAKTDDDEGDVEIETGSDFKFADEADPTTARSAQVTEFPKSEMAEAPRA